MGLQYSERSVEMLQLSKNSLPGMRSENLRSLICTVDASVDVADRSSNKWKMGVARGRPPGTIMVPG